MKLIRAAILSLFALAFSSAAIAQSSPGLVYGQVPTAAQWNSYFAAKQDVLGYTPVNKAGDTMLGRLTMAASTSTTAGFRLSPGSAPGSPVNGDMWMTTAGVFAQVNGGTVGPFAAADSATFAATAPLSVTFPAGVVTFALDYTADFELSGSDLSLATAQPSAHTWAATQTFTLAPVFTDQSGSRSALGLGTAATQNTGTSGNKIPFLDGNNTWSGTNVFQAAITYGGVTLSNSVTGTGSMVLSAAPTITGHPTIEGVTSTGATGTGNFVFGTSPSIASLTVTGSFTATGLVTNAALANPSTTVNGQTCTLGSTCTVTAVASSLVVGTTTISSGTTTRVLFDNAGVVGEYSISGSGNVAMTTSPAFTTPNIGVATATSVNKVAITAPATSATLTIADGKTLTDTSSVGASILLGTTGGGFSAYAGASCTNQALTALSAAGAGTCASITNSFLTAGTFSNITGVGTLVAGTASTGFTIQSANVTWSGSIAGANVAAAADTSGSPSATFGVVKCDGTTIICSSGVITSVGGAATDVTIGVTTVTSGTNGYLLSNNSGVLGNVTIASVLSAGNGILVTGTTTAGIAADIATAAQVAAGTANKIVDSAVAVSSAAPFALTPGATVTPDLNAGMNFSLTPNQNFTLANPSNIAGKTGRGFCIWITNDSTPRTITLDTSYFGPGGSSTIALTASAGAKDQLCGAIVTTTQINVTINGPFSH